MANPDVKEDIKKRKGFFLCIEGIDGSGKTTQSKELVKTLRKLGYPAIYTTEPTKGYFGRLIREHVLQRKERIPVFIESILFALDRLDHVKKEISPLLKTGKIIVCDRYVHSSISYQGSNGAQLDWIKKINRFSIKPDLTLYIDVQPEVALKRITKTRNENLDVMEDLETQKKVRNIFLKLVKEEEIVLIKGNESKENVKEAIKKNVLIHLKQRE